jgi:hypothetical protein
VLAGQGDLPDGHHPMTGQLTDEQLLGFLADLRKITADGAAALPAHGDFLRQQCAAGSLSPTAAAMLTRSMVETLSHKQARRIALAAQGFADGRPETPTRRHLTAVIERLALLQIDSVNVVSRSHYLPLFSRLGAYPRALLEDLAWGKKPTLFEYWGHEASLMPLDLQPLLRWRMEDARQGVGVWKCRQVPGRAPAVHRQGAGGHPRARPAVGRRTGAGRTRPGRLVGLERGQAGDRMPVLGRRTDHRHPARNVRTRLRPSREGAAQGDLVGADAVARGGAPHPAGPRGPRHRRRHRARPARLFPHGPRRRPARRRGTGRERRPDPGRGGGLGPAGLSGARRSPAAQDHRQRPALSVRQPDLVPRTGRALFDVRIRLEIYTPAHKRTHGYYVLPFLQGEAITARVDLKADRKAGLLRVLSAHGEPTANAATASALAAELRLMAAWLGLAGVAVAASGDLAPPWPRKPPDIDFGSPKPIYPQLRSRLGESAPPVRPNTGGSGLQTSVI